MFFCVVYVCSEIGMMIAFKLIMDSKVRGLDTIALGSMSRPLLSGLKKRGLTSLVVTKV
jgi:hypothetical protein